MDYDFRSFLIVYSFGEAVVRDLSYFLVMREVSTDPSSNLGPSLSNEISIPRTSSPVKPPTSLVEP